MVKLENLAREREVVDLCFGRSQEMISWLHYDVIMISLPVEVPPSDETLSEERDITLL